MDTNRNVFVAWAMGGWCNSPVLATVDEALAWIATTDAIGEYSIDAYPAGTRISFEYGMPHKVRLGNVWKGTQEQAKLVGIGRDGVVMKQAAAEIR